MSGKLLVEGQTRYLCRDLLPLLVSLLEKETDMGGFFTYYLFDRFYLPMTSNQQLDKNGIIFPIMPFSEARIFQEMNSLLCGVLQIPMKCITQK